jgi:15-cis-phytoene synthase
MQNPSVASEITRRAKSNLAFALRILPRERREAMTVFYAFCRTMDDLADDPGMSPAERSVRLSHWRRGLIEGFDAPDRFEGEVVSLRDRHGLPTELLVAIIDGCEMDLCPQRFEDWDELSGYSWKVACAVGLVSIRLFGCRHPASERYAVALGHALQLTNILRDVGEDIANGGRIYLPLADLRRFGCTPADLEARVHDDRFVALMEYEAARAEEYFREAAAVMPREDRAALVPARIMAEIYRKLLAKMQADRFQVFRKRYALSKARKFAILSKHLIARPSRVE